MSAHHELAFLVLRRARDVQRSKADYPHIGGQTKADGSVVWSANATSAGHQVA
jgi:hypothetical protein